MTILVNRFNTPAGKEAGLLEMVNSWAETIGQAPGCNSFSVYTDPDAPGSVVTLEDWDSRQAHEAFRDSIPPEMMSDAMQFMTGMPEGFYLDQA